jgi:NitT/TauT family transport system substrate-binding protein
MHDYDADPGAQTAGILYGPDFAKGPLATPFITAYLQGVRTYNDGFVKKDPAARQKAIDALIKHTAVKDKALFDQMGLQGLEGDGTMNLKSLEEQQDFWVAHNEQQQKVDLAKVVDDQFVKAAVAKIGAYK